MTPFQHIRKYDFLTPFNVVNEGMKDAIDINSGDSNTVAVKKGDQVDTQNDYMKQMIDQASPYVEHAKVSVALFLKLY